MKKGLGVLVLAVLVLALSAGQSDDIIQLKDRIIEIQNKGELGFAYFNLCSKIFGFASYLPLQEPLLGPNDTLQIYYEPVNVFTNIKEGLYEIWYTQDMALLNSSGDLIQEWKDILTFHYLASRPALDLFAQNSLSFDGSLSPGKYLFRAHLKDKLSGKTASKTIEFEIRVIDGQE